MVHFTLYQTIEAIVDKPNSNQISISNPLPEGEKRNLKIYFDLF